MADWSHIVQAITKPLNFASKNDFANLHQIKGLEKLMEGLGHQALSLELGESQKRLIQELLKIFPGFEGSSIEEKKERITRSMRIVTQLEGYGDKAEEKGKPEVGGKRLEAKVKGDAKAEAEVKVEAERKVKVKSKVLSQPIQYVKGVGPGIAKKLEKKGIRIIEDALYFLPRRYEDRRVIKKISEIQVGKVETVLAEVLLAGTVLYRGNRKRVFEVIVGDGTGTLTLKWFRGSQEYLKSRFKKGRRVIISGEVRLLKGGKTGRNTSPPLEKRGG